MINQTPVARIESAINDAVNEIGDRDKLLGALGKVRNLGFEKIELKNTKNNERISWARIIIQSCSASEQIIKSKENEELKIRIDSLEVYLENIKEFVRLEEDS